MPLRRREFEGEMWEWGRVPRTKQPGWYPWRGRGYMPDVKRGRGIGPRRGEWRWRGHGPDVPEGYGWEFRGGAPRGEHQTWPENVPARGMEGGRLREELRSGGFPRDRERFEAEGGWTPGAPPPGPRGRPLPRRGASEVHDYAGPYRRPPARRRRFRPTHRRARTEPARRYDAAYGGRPYPRRRRRA